MQLTRYTDYSLRVLLYLAVDQNRNPPVTVDELSQQFQISRNHLVKIVHELGQRGLLLTARGRGGGVRLAKDPSEYRIVDIIEQLEGGRAVIDCKKIGCVLTGKCGLSGALWRAIRHFFDELNQYTLADAMDAETVAAVEALHPTLEVLMHSREICRHHPDAEAADKTSAQKKTGRKSSSAGRIKIYEVP